MKEFFMQLISNSNRIEFPENEANHFKTRLPYPLRFQESGWKVGLASISLPRAPPPLKLKDTFLFRIKWYEMIDPLNEVYAPGEVTIHEGEVSGAVTGTEFMNAIRTQQLRQLEDHTVSDLRLTDLRTDLRI